MLFSILGTALSLRRARPYDPNDFLFSPAELRHKYQADPRHGEHPHFSRSQWLQAVNSGASELGYWQWVFEQVQSDDDTFLLHH